jgi:hypothetical protein
LIKDTKGANFEEFISEKIKEGYLEKQVYEYQGELDDELVPSRLQSSDINHLKNLLRSPNEELDKIESDLVKQGGH